MPNKLSYIFSPSTLPYENLAMEEYLFNHVAEDECILYLWQNQKTVVIGRNQNSWQECKLALLEQEGGYLARRLSGGGAVFHDLGNLNFTFLLHKQNYNLNRQLEVIINALAELGIKAEKSGRNDITIKGQKFSGNAFYHSHNRSYHHGTLMVNADLANLSKYLTVSPEKFKSKGISSVQARVTNLVEHKPDLTIKQLKTNLVQAFGKVYQGTPQEIFWSDIPSDKLQQGISKFSDPNWLHPKEIPFTYELKKYFSWGQVQIRLSVSQRIIQDVQVFSDAMAANFADSLSIALIGCHFSSKAMAEAMGKAKLTDDLLPAMLIDLQALILAEHL